jgi:hypothetical protein
MTPARFALGLGQQRHDAEADTEVNGKIVAARV